MPTDVRRPGALGLGRRRALGAWLLLALLLVNLPAGLPRLWSSAPLWVQVCSAQGMRWVAEGSQDQPLPAVLKADCPWAQAQQGMPPFDAVGPMPALAPASPQAWTPRTVASTDGVARVLLMAAMRAPPPA